MLLYVMYCSKCKYELRGCPEHRCPECGQRFDPNDPKSYLSFLPGWHEVWLSSVLKRLLPWFPLMLIVYVAGMWNWRNPFLRFSHPLPNAIALLGILLLPLILVVLASQFRRVWMRWLWIAALALPSLCSISARIRDVYCDRNIDRHWPRPGLRARQADST